jgi:hypothetical protein
VRMSGVLPPALDAGIEIVHRLVGYPLAFVVAPLAVATFAGKPGHHWAGKAYVVVMTFLYVTGTALTLTRHPWGTWEFGRNVVFNMLGYSLLLHGFRSMWLVSHPQAPRPALLDRVLLGSLVVLVAALALLAAMHTSAPMHVFAVIGAGFVALEVRDWRAGLTRPLLYRRHVRYMLGSYFYVLTVVSLVHLRDELTSDARWLWPAAIALAVIWLVGEGSRANRWAVRATLVVAMLFGAYVSYDIAANGFTSARAGQR